MIILKPISKERIWGTGRLHNYAGDKTIEKIGSVYSISGIPEISNEIVSGDEHLDLYEAVKNNPKKFGLGAGQVYPVIISFTAADENLSVQVHPTDEYAKSHEAEVVGKSESWYFIEEPTDGWIYAESLLENKEEIKKLVSNGEIDQVVGKKAISKGDLAFIESGTLHALTPGALVYEIQQSTDITYRFYDYNRVDKNGDKRELHLGKAMETLSTENKVKVTDFESDEPVDEVPYTLIKTNSIKHYVNDNQIAVSVSAVRGNVMIDGNAIPQGSSGLILPKEEVEIVYEDGSEIIFAIPHLYFS